MSFTVTCPNCGAASPVPDAADGKRVKCKACGQAFAVRRPRATGDDEEADTPPRSRAVPPSAPPSKSRPKPARDEDGEDEAPRTKSARSARRPADEDEDRPRRRPRDEDEEDRPRDRGKKGQGAGKKKGSPVLLFVLLGLGGLIVAGGAVAAAIYFLGGKDPATPATAATGGPRPGGDPVVVPPGADPGRGPTAASTSLPPTKTLSVDLKDILNFSLSPDGSVVGLAGVGVKQPGGKEEHLSVFYDLSTGKRVGVPIDLNGPGVISNGAKSTAFTDFGELFVRDISTGEQTAIGKDLKEFAFSPDGKVVVTAVGPKVSFRPWPATSGEPKEVTSESPVIGLSNVFQQGTRVATVHNDAKGVLVRVWDVRAGKATEDVPLGRPKINGSDTRHRLAVADDGRAMVVTNEQGAREVWDLAGKKKLDWTGKHFATSFQPVTGGLICFLKSEIKVNGGQVSNSMFVSVVNLQTGDVVHKLEFPGGVESHTGSHLGVSADGKRFVSWSDDTKKLYVWDLPGR